jgi:hypothetical protein
MLLSDVGLHNSGIHLDPGCEGFVVAVMTHCHTEVGDIGNSVENVTLENMQAGMWLHFKLGSVRLLNL